MTSIDFVVYYPAEMEIKKILLISLLWQDYVENTASCVQNYTLDLGGSGMFWAPEAYYFCTSNWPEIEKTGRVFFGEEYGQLLIKKSE